ncbi:NAD(P)-binding protein [Mycena venus]|uniref:NAD(P)-binding protein n=1 Tax=Mycena venus TaxID=2733690 RepID=A0A8H6XJC0_9AGAR|nr:NAD(P)-binding protein [Mycena venus]
MSSKTVYLISGANRGIGYKLASIIAARPDTIVFAGARDPTAQSLKDLSAKHPNVHAVKLTSADEADNAAAIAEIQRIAGHLDVIIANAGIAKYYGPLATTPLSELREHWEVNTLGLVVLFQAAHRLLLASPTNAPIFAFISSIAGSMGQHVPIQGSPYGSSKAASNFLIKSLHYENPTLIAMAIHPGFVVTEMGMDCAKAIGIPKPTHNMDEAMAGVMSRIDGATREASGGRFWNFKVTRGNPWDVETEEVPW